MCWALLAIMAMARTGAYMASHRVRWHGNRIVYLIGTMALCAVEVFVLTRLGARQARVQIAVRSSAAILLAWIVAWALWPWLQIGNPLTRFKIAYTHFATLVSEFQFVDWGRWLWTSAPWSYIPDQWLARLPIGFLALLALAILLAIVNSIRFIRLGLKRFRQHGTFGLRHLLLLIARDRNILLIWIAAILPLSFIMTQQASLYDGIRHTLFIIPVLGVIAGWAAVRPWRSLGKLRVLGAVCTTIYGAYLAADLVIHECFCRKHRWRL